ncbi:hypothetical protein LCGC14_2848670 [marine sediment metagenome]|uniref:Uncharacterized protein n=1 Tax=marine sediment metagenome TaxID=412755 RepID=A0A0F8Y960_9ZZZZ
MADRVLRDKHVAHIGQFTTGGFGFNWRPKDATAWTRVHRMWSHRGQAVLRIDSGNQSAASTIDIYVSKGGRSIRVFRGNKELT